MPATAMVHVRVDEQVKEGAAATLAGLGLTVSAAVKIFLMRVASEKAFPFDIRVPNAQTLAAMGEADDLFDDLEKPRAR